MYEKQSPVNALKKEITTLAHKYVKHNQTVMRTEQTVLEILSYMAIRIVIVT